MNYEFRVWGFTIQRIYPDILLITQILRSSSEWSAGLYDTERSIQNGYLYAIEKSQHFIYIEVTYYSQY